MTDSLTDKLKAIAIYAPVTAAYLYCETVGAETNSCDDCPSGGCEYDSILGTPNAEGSAKELYALFGRTAEADREQ